MRKIGLAAARVDANLTQMEMARAVGVSKNLIVDWEKGRKYPNAEQFERYCKACGRPTSDINCGVLVVKHV